MTGLLDIFNYGTGNDFLNEKKKEIERLERGSLYRAGGGDAQNTWRSGDQSQKKSFQETMMKNNQWGNQNPYKEADNSLSRKEKLIKAYTPNQNVANASKSFFSTDSSKNIYIDDQGNKRSRTTGKIITTDGKKWGMDDTGGADLGKWHGNNQQEQLKWWQVLANKAGIDFDKAAASWKEKGGFEGLMANPAFTMGLAFMQAGAEGKTLGSGALNNVMKAAGISSHYKQILKDREQAPIEVTAQDVGEVKSLLQSMDISGPSNVEKFFGFLKGERKMEFKWDLASEEIAVELQKEIKKLKENKKPGAPEVVYDTTKKLQILKRMFDEGRFKKKGGTWLTDATLQTTQKIPTLDSNKPKINKNNPLKGYVGFAQGGQIQEGQPAIVGEGGPEYFLPKESGKILSNDDSRIFAMLLAANPQLQQVSRTRSEKILRNRFPEYFE